MDGETQLHIATNISPLHVIKAKPTFFTISHPARNKRVGAAVVPDPVRCILARLKRYCRRYSIYYKISPILFLLVCIPCSFSVYTASISSEYLTFYQRIQEHEICHLLAMLILQAVEHSMNDTVNKSLLQRQSAVRTK